MATPEKNLHPRKIKYEKTLLECLDKYTKLLVIEVDNVGSKQMSETRFQLRDPVAYQEKLNAAGGDKKEENKEEDAGPAPVLPPKAQILMGKNTVIRKILRREAKSNAGLVQLMKVMRGNVGFVFTNGDLIALRDSLLAKQDPAPAKTGQVAPKDVWVEPGPTGLDPGQTAFFQALNIATKINKGAIEIVARVRMCTEGEKVSASAAGLLAKLSITPFSFGIKVKHVYEWGPGKEGSCYPAAVLDLTDAEIMKMFAGGLIQASCISLGLGYPSMASIPHLMSNAVRKIIAFSIETKYKMEIAEDFEAFLANPDAFKVVAAAGAGGAEVAKEAPKKEEEEDDGGFDFDDEDDE